MIELSEYIEQINKFDIEKNLNKTISSIKEAKEIQKLCLEYQRSLRQIKKSIVLDIKTIRLEYKDKIAGAGSTLGGVFSLFGKRRLGGSIRADAKRGMTKERDSVISPYEELKLVIDNYIYAIDDIKNQLKEYISEEKNKKDSLDTIATEHIEKFCTSCGSKLEKSHKFCAHCGKKSD